MLKHKHFVPIVLFVAFFAALIGGQFINAASKDIVISEIRVGNNTTTRVIELYNNSTEPVEITDWCLYYSTPSNAMPFTEVGCFTVLRSNIHKFLKPHSFALLASSTVSPVDIEITSGLGTGAAGHIYLMNQIGNIVDRVGWGTAIAPEGQAKSISSTKVIQRIKNIESNTFVDTDNNGEDFIDAALPDPSIYQQSPYRAIYDVIDLCIDVTGIQETIPNDLINDGSGICMPPVVDFCASQIPGYGYNDAGDCVPDVCINIPELQIVIPNGYEFDNNGYCVQHDECSNIDDIQVIIPSGFSRGDNHSCELILNILPIIITELLPNPVGADEGSDDINTYEYIEFYNPNDSEVDLLYYVFYVGSNDTDFYSFPVGSKIGAKQYLKFSNREINFTLVNTSGSVRLRAIDNSFSNIVPDYSNAGDGMAWALINDEWQYTNRPTPNAANLPSYHEIIETPIIEPEGLVPCAANQYRNPLTNRCKLLPEYASQLEPCRVGQYRSEETNRCRSIVTDVVDLAPCAEGQERNPATNRCRMIAADVANLVPCAEGQERNPLTNRCRNIVGSVLGDSILAPCKPGQERNPTTNRCRNIVSMPTAEYKPEKVNTKSNNDVLMWSLATVAIIALGYAIWEWRSDIKKLYKKLLAALKHKNRL